MKALCARFGTNVDDSAGALAVLGLVVVQQDLDFADCVHVQRRV